MTGTSNLGCIFAYFASPMSLSWLDLRLCDNERKWLNVARNAILPRYLTLSAWLIQARPNFSKLRIKYQFKYLYFLPKTYQNKFDKHWIVWNKSTNGGRVLTFSQGVQLYITAVSLQTLLWWPRGNNVYT